MLPSQKHVLEDVEERHAKLEKSDSEEIERRFRQLRTSNYAQSQNDQNQPTSPLVLVLSIKPPDPAESHDLFRAWHPPASFAVFQPTDNKTKHET